MFSIANLLELAKVKAGIDSDYRLAKVLRINQSALSNYRSGRNLPNIEILEALCALSGDDAGLIVAQVEAERAAEAALVAIGDFGCANDPMMNAPPPGGGPRGFMPGPRYPARVLRSFGRRRSLSV